MIYVMCKIVASGVSEGSSKYRQFTKSSIKFQLCLFEAIKSLEFDDQNMEERSKAIWFNQKREKC